MTTSHKSLEGRIRYNDAGVANRVAQEGTLRDMAHRASRHSLVPLPFEVKSFGYQAKVAVPGSAYYQPGQLLQRKTDE